MKPTFRPICLAVLLLCAANRAGADGVSPSPQFVAATAEPSAALISAPLNNLPIPQFPRGKLRVEIDASDGDLLGVVKSFFEGINPRTFQALAPTRTATEAAAPVSPAAELSRVLSQTDLRSLLANVKHIHFVSYEIPYRHEPEPGMETAAPIVLPRGGEAVHPMPPRPKKAMPTRPVPEANPASANARYFIDAFARENSHTVSHFDFDDFQLFLLAFPNLAAGGQNGATPVPMGGAESKPGQTANSTLSDNGGFAVIVADRYSVSVFRSDGYPDFSGLGAVSAAQLSVFLQQLSALPSR